jgi:hypothetical protein
MSIRDLSVLMCAAGFTRWHMMLRPDEHTGTAHRMRDVTLPGYFNDATDMMAAGDMIDVSAQDGGATLYVTEARRSPDSVRVRVMCSVDTGEL